MEQSEQIDVGGTTPVSKGAEYDLLDVVAAMRSLSQRVAAGEGECGPVEQLVEVAVQRVPGVRWASGSILREGLFTTAASTGEQAVRADVLQYEIGSGPSIDALQRGCWCVTGGVGADSRWSDWGQRVNAEVGVNSVLSQPLQLQDQCGVGALNLYSDAHDAFDQVAVGMALILATHAGLALSASLALNRAGNLSRALQSNREIGVAMGILMHQSRFTREEAFDALRVASQNSNHRLADIAAAVVESGTLTINHREVQGR